LSTLETVLIFLGIPLGVALVVTGLVYGVSSRRSSKRYRPGRPFEFQPVWFLSVPEQVSDPKRAALAAGAAAGEPALPVGKGAEPAGGSGEPAPHGATGGASDRW
jgi:hypothetical protein